MSRLYFIRHAQAGPRTAYDALSELGREQARRLGEYLAVQQIQFEAIYTGALRRQQETAQVALAACGRAGCACPELVTEPRWNEFDLSGMYQELAPLLAAEDPEFARDWEELQRALADERASSRRATTRCDIAIIRAWIEGRHPIQGEPWQAFRSRIESSLAMFDGLGPGEAVAVFTSATPTAIFVGMALGLFNEKVLRLAGVVYNTGITTLRLRNRDLTLFSFNAIPHLPEPRLRTFR